MTLRERLEQDLEDLNPKSIKIDKNDAYKGNEATTVSLVMHNPLGMPTGDLEFKFTYISKLGLKVEDVAHLVRVNAERQAKAFVFDMDTEL